MLRRKDSVDALPATLAGTIANQSLDDLRQVINTDTLPPLFVAALPDGEATADGAAMSYPLLGRELSVDPAIDIIWKSHLASSPSGRWSRVRIPLGRWADDTLNGSH